MPSLEYDRTFLQAGIPELEKYLLSDEIYWPLGLRALQGEAPFPRMTLGWLLLARERARGWQASGIPPAQSHVIEQLAIRMDAIRTRWRAAWENKARQEFRSRLTLWTNFINEYRKDRGGHANRYPYEVQRRAMLHLLQQEAREIPDPELELLHRMDRFLQSVLAPGEFVWEAEIAPAFPRDVYWYLYGSLPAGA